MWMHCIVGYNIPCVICCILHILTKVGYPVIPCRKCVCCSAATTVQLVLGWWWSVLVLLRCFQLLYWVLSLGSFSSFLAGQWGRTVWLDGPVLWLAYWTTPANSLDPLARVHTHEKTSGEGQAFCNIMAVCVLI